MEIWKDILSYESCYQISTLGNVRSLTRTVNSKLNSSAVKQGKQLKLMLDKYGYNVVNLYKDGKYKSTKVHRLVAIAFIYNPQCKPEVNHKDGVKTNNNVSNLEWCTTSENQTHAVKNNLINHAKGEQLKQSKLKERDIYIIYRSELTHTELAETYGVSRRAISKVKNGESWKHITQNL